MQTVEFETNLSIFINNVAASNLENSSRARSFRLRRANSHIVISCATLLVAESARRVSGVASSFHGVIADYVARVLQPLFTCAPRSIERNDTKKEQVPRFVSINWPTCATPARSFQRAAADTPGRQISEDGAFLAAYKG